MDRPTPPSELLDDLEDRFTPDEAFREWIVATFINPAGSLHNPEHEHLQFATLGILWTNVHNARQMRIVIGQAELMPPQAMGKWQRARAEQQVTEWFGHIPDFMLTFHAGAAVSMDDTSFCALVEHELYHCGQKRDDSGLPKFKQDGTPSFGIRGHDVEEFVGVVARYGATDVVAQMVDAAASAPTMPRLDIARACGTCCLKAA